MTETDEVIPEEDLVPEDDTIIGKAFRWSLLGIVLIGLVAAGVFYLTRKPPQQEVVIEKQKATVEDLRRDLAVLPNVCFTDITQAAGIEFVHFNGATGECLLPETMGGGAAFLDVDQDGDQDLVLVNSCSWPKNPKHDPPPHQALYLNDGKGKFTDATRGSGLDQTFYGMGVACGDYDGDADTDLYFTGVGGCRLFRNDAMRFTDVTKEAKVAGSDQEWSTGSGFFDYDRDGDLDLFVCNYVHWSRDIDIKLAFTLNGKDRAYGPPTQYSGSSPCLYRNEGNGTFTEVGEQAGLHVTNAATGLPMAKSLGVSFVDIDRDGWMDITVANDTVQNCLFHNRGDGTFEDIGVQSGFGYDSRGNARGAMGIDCAYYRNDASLAIAIGNFANEMTSFFVSQRNPLMFSDDAIVEGIGSPSRKYLKFGVLFFDFDLDGRMDFFECNGHLEDSIQEVQESQTYEQPAQLFWNAGPDHKSCFVEMPREKLGDLTKPIVGRGATFADIDADGDIDLLLTQVHGTPMLLRNDQKLGNHWLRLKLRGKKPNADAIGAWVELTAGGTTQRRQVMPTRSYLSQVELPLTFGLGALTKVDSIEVHWPDGSKQSVPPPASVDAVLDVHQSSQ